MKLSIVYRSVILTVMSLTIFSIVISYSTIGANAISSSDWRPGHIIDDSIFYNKSAMTAQQIQQFLDAKVPVCDRNRASSNPSYQPPWTCLKEYQENTVTKENNIGRFNANGTPYNVPGGKLAGQIIWDVAQEYGINPQVLIVMLQKEQGLVTDNWPWKVQYQKAMGYACPDTAPCDAQYYGFYNQVSSAAWQLKRYIAYPNNYNFKVGVSRYIQYNPNAACGGSQVYLVNAATAALYNYTPYQPNQSALNNLYGSGDNCGAYGNRNFWRYFNDWFGATSGTECYSANQPVSQPSGLRVLSLKRNNVSTLGLSILNNTGSNCIEVHQWRQDYKNWQFNIATVQPEIDPASGELFSLASPGATNRLVYVKYKNTANNLVELHEFGLDLQDWTSHILTSLPVSDLNNGKIISRGETLVFVKYKNTSYGKVEFHEFSPNLRSWSSHIVSNQPASEIANGTIVNRGDRLVFVKYLNGKTKNNMIEMHEWLPGYQGWAYNTVSNQIASEMNYGKIVGLNDRLVFIKYKNTAASYLEIHEWLPGYQWWSSHIISNKKMSETLSQW